MADSTITVEDLRNLLLDAQALEKFINDAANVANPGQATGTLTTRRDQTYKNLQRLIAEIEAANANRIEVQAAGAAIVSSASALNFGAGFSVTVNANDPTVADVVVSASGGNVFNDLSDLQADTTSAYPVGTRITVKSHDRCYYVPAQPITDAHLTTAGGVGLYEAGPQYTTAARMRQAVQLGIVPEGAQFGCFGFWYTKDASATGLDSAFHDFGIDGVERPNWLPDNLYLATLFQSQVNEQQFFYTSPDALTWKRLNRLPQRANQNDRLIGGRDADIVFYPPTGELIRPVTAGTAQSQFDCSSWRSRDGLTHDLYRHWFGPTQFRPTLPDPNGDGSTQQIWGPRIFHDKASDEYYFVFTARTGPDYTNQLGNPSPTFRPHIARINNLQTLETDAPVMMGIEDANFASLSPDIIRPGGTTGNYFLAIKDSAARNVRIYQSATLLGTWSLVTTLDFDATFESIEGPAWAPYIYRDSSSSVATEGPRALKYRLIVAHNRDLNDNLLGEQIYFEADTITGAWTGPFNADWPYAVRNGGVKNMPFEYSSDPRAMQIVNTLISGLSGDAPDGFEERVRLIDGTSTIYPQQDNLYYSFAARDAQVTIGRNVGDRFSIMVSDDPSTTTACGITIAGNSFIDAFTLGYSNTSERGKIVTFEWTEPRDGTSDFSGKYRPVLDRQGSGGGTADGVVTGGSYSGSGKQITLTRSESLADVTVDLGSLPYRFFGNTHVLRDAAGNDAWGIRDATVDGDLIPFGAARGIGRSTDPITGVWFEGQSTDGTSDGNNDWRLIFANNGSPRVQNSSTTGNNQGYDISGIQSWSTTAVTSGGTVTWSREDGSGRLLSGTAGADVTFDFSSMVVGDTLDVIIANPGGRAFTWTGPRAILWTDNGGNPPPTDAGREVKIAFRYVTSSRLEGVWFQEPA